MGDLEIFLKDKLKSDFEKIKEDWQACKDGLISRKELIGRGIKLLGKTFVNLMVDDIGSFI